VFKVAEQRYQGWFLDEVARAGSRILLADYDGTLAPLLEGGKGSVSLPDIRELLEAVMRRGTRVIVVSARPAHQVAHHLAAIGIQPAPEVWGNDGLERIHPDGSYECGDLNATLDLLRALSDCESQLEELGLKSRVEVKLTGVTVQWRGLAPAEKLDVRTRAYRVFHPITTLHPELKLVAVVEGFELRLPVAGKGEAVRRLMSLSAQDTAIAYLGHSTSDEEVFRALNGRGMTVLVAPFERFTAAQICLRPPYELVRFLEDWIRATE
jgi:trehalose 6-phosphate phosphatase